MLCMLVAFASAVLSPKSLEGELWIALLQLTHEQEGICAIAGARANPMMAVVGNTLWLLGGLVEVRSSSVPSQVTPLNLCVADNK